MDDTNARIDSRQDGDHRRHYRTAPLGSPGDQDSAHSIAVCETLQETLATATASLSRGLHIGETCIATGTSSFLTDLEAALKARGIDVSAATDRGDLLLVPLEETYLASEPVTADSMARWLLEYIDDLNGDPIRVVGRLSEPISAALEPAILEEYERRVETLVEQHAVHALCLYDRAAFSDAMLQTALTQHPTYRTPIGAYSNVAIDELADTALSTPAGETDLDHLIQVLKTLSNHIARSRQLDVLTGFAESITRTQTDCRSRVLESTISLLETLFSPTLSTGWLYDNAAGQLKPETDSQPALATLESLPSAVSEHAWDAYSGDNVISTIPLPSAAVSDAVCDLPIDSLTFVPLGRHGVLMLVHPAYVSLTDTDEAFLQTIQTTVQAIFDTTTHRDTIDTQASTLERQQHQIQELEELISLLQRATQELVDATSRADIERMVCTQLARTSFLEFAWFGRPSDGATTLSPTHSGPSGETYLESVTANETQSALEPAVTTYETGQTTIINEIVSEPPFEPWRSHALRRGYRSIASVPVIYQESTYGVLTMYSARLNAFDEQVTAAIETIGESVGHAINAREKQQALISGELTVLELQIEDRSLPSIGLAAELGTSIHFEEIVSQENGLPQTYFTVRDRDRETVEAAATRCYGIDDVSHVVERENGHLYTSLIDNPCLFQHVLERGGVPDTMDVSAERANITVELPKSISTRSFISMLEQRFETVSITAQESRERDFHVRDEFKQAFEETLSDRQKEVLRAAYYSGYFDKPRESTGQDIADQLGVSQPTVTENIRAAERKLVTLLFEAN
ncbi:GAF domain-containing protein [Natronolimnobius sp. AArcel1]|uniref:bacterio-opsin activator domain-containing protein n=1 Tax=Natronolimnobius sp. AArcel1 TaxID=1679093 RepID=UPI0013EB5D90|nr:bacterio-opsin activator domain-containing protein [Natronolimnobius sp. AArcel1]NGM68561.1 GAF domain-containing protein [Natronolimnobius sp. AArcel1]